MEKKYSVFVSSTYEDLIEERQEVVNALLQMDCFPVGMEYFNASDQSQWEVIKMLISECDYYILIIAGRYGSVEPISGKSYTQLEYEYAKSIGVPVIAFIHQHPEDIKQKFVENTHRQELEDFKNMVKTSLVRYWIDAKELAGQVVLSLNSMFKTHPRVGWMRASEKSSSEQNKEILRLQKENEELKGNIKRYEENGPEGVNELSQGDEEYVLHYTYGVDEKKAELIVTWNNICRILLPKLTQDCAESMLKMTLKNYIEECSGGYRVVVHEQDFQTIKVQLMALGYIEESAQPKTRRDYIGAWHLTKYGKTILMRLTAVRRNLK